MSEKPQPQESRWYRSVINRLLLQCNNFNDTHTKLTYFPFSILNTVNLMFYTSFCWKWPASCHVFVKWPVGQKQLDHAALEYLPTLWWYHEWVSIGHCEFRWATVWQRWVLDCTWIGLGRDYDEFCWFWIGSADFLAFFIAREGSGLLDSASERFSSVYHNVWPSCVSQYHS